MKILFASSEATPLIKTGGLADVAGSLPAALNNIGQDCRLILPGYPDVLEKADNLQSLTQLEIAGETSPVRLLQGSCGPHRVPLYVIDAPHRFNRAGNPYLSPEGMNWPDNAERFSLFCHAVTELALNRIDHDWQPDVVHANDWQTGLIAPLLSTQENRPATLFTIHNLAYQGLFDHATFLRLGLPDELWSYHHLEFHDQLSFIKGGIALSDRVNTVSPSYAAEIKTAEFGYGLEGLLNHRKDHFSGVLNGIDYHEWDPLNDRHIDTPYSAESFADKRNNKLALQQEYGLPEDENIQLFGYIGRLVDQKGVDLILQVLPGIMDAGAQMVMLGSGNKDLEHALEKISNRYHSRVGVFIGYDEGLSHRIEAGCDSFIMPSRFEPCGLNQMYSLRYGTVPIVRRTGGLADTVVDVNPTTLVNGSATGFVFDNADGSSLWGAMEHAINFYRRSATDWEILARTGMQQDFSWEASAQHYLELYQTAIDEPGL
ncbi:MAG: glycogen synthase GlgA [Candidatus Thiodiazotropha sp. (ex Lucina aurantia)]|uniref:Glycogen synthase n=2 Tax=Candidatus Thiodiazotropha TaxID=1913444 RepID=A0A7Z1AGM8_9GAMM|nr:glycogen synthase GlgA [Candidatus Thiodiazotropha endolucinida]MBT3014968.1 glycogen synthase GlgA [Candidatus Thiodiazotropha taylori]MBT3038431.1 glycogen synthase GlgA [Candidatus Thiodiazotropha sp. (ex Codakia orbicularis)]MBT3091502.1 glycogen synthase GlgA [Candidatus Thiodiazotropha sp. (ex Lucina pensylvanica)]MBV2102878.1 glycogen synthase GlgA [Candidatus Thiodiazotropha sp. (ex Lucina aurantia)]MBT3023101.1 glycogen synthase GlgA [Candidatus Thiodiazotropha taylori]